MSDPAANDKLVLQVEITSDQAEALLAPRIREALSASGTGGKLRRRKSEPGSSEDSADESKRADLTDWEHELETREQELDERARRLNQREAELGSVEESGEESERGRLTEWQQQLEVREQGLDVRERDLDKREADLGSWEKLPSEGRVKEARHELVLREHELAVRERDLAEREAALDSSDNPETEAERSRLAERQQKLDLAQEDLASREQAFTEREAEFEADVLMREERIEQWRAELDTVARDLERRGRDLAAYVQDLQSSLSDEPTPEGKDSVTELRRSA